MENKPLVSIIIAAYNPGEYLQNTLESCIDQTYENTEIIILDNHSSEDIGGLITGWFDGLIENTEGSKYKITIPTTKNQQPKTIQLIKSPKNLGPYRGLNRLLEEVNGEYIAIQDHDDIWHKDKITKQVEFLEAHPEYIGCGTNTIMYYEADHKYFEYYLEEKNYYTVHPSLLFRNLPPDKGGGRGVSFRYDTRVEYMCDAYSLKYNLCHGEKKIYNLAEPLTLHLIKATSSNHSYRWHTLSISTIQRAYALHSFAYATLTLGWELMRKMLYPALNLLRLTHWINPIERIPFRMMGKHIKTTQGNEWWGKYF